MARYMKLAGLALAFLIITIGAFFLAESITQNDSMRSFVQSLGIFGVVLVGLATGLNALVPIPPATFAPLFLEAGLSEWVVIIGFVVGTTTADSLSFLLGWFGSGYAKDHYPNFTKRLGVWLEKHCRLIPFIVFGFFTLAPMPNETILLPLALAGYQYRKLIGPLILGNIIHHTLMVYGYQNLFEFFF